MKRTRAFKTEITSANQGVRIDRFLSIHLPDHSRTFYQRLINEAHVRVNGKPVKPSYKLEPGDWVEGTIPPPQETDLAPENIPLDIRYEDEHLIVINKPAGMVVHPGAGVRQGTLVNALLCHCRNLSGVGGRLRPGIVHRLDKNTSGLLVVAKDDQSHIHLQKQFADKTATRVYRALVWGRLKEPAGTLETRLNRSKSDRKKFVVAETGKTAITEYRTLKNYEFLTLVEVRLKTGRTHQIRTHFNYLGHPVFGDPEYSGRRKQLNRLSSLSLRQFGLYLLTLMNRQALHAYTLGFIHPVTRQSMQFEVDFPADFTAVLEHLENPEGS